MRRLLPAALLLALAASCSGNDAPPPSTLITVASRNLYLGGDIFKVAAAQNPTAAAVAAREVWETVKFTNFPERAKLIAAELASVNADVVGLQEVSLWRTGAPLVCNPNGSGLPVINDPQASTVVYDFLALLQAELQALGLEYDEAMVTEGIDAELCAADPDPTKVFDIRYTDRDVLLVRKGLATANADGGRYSAYVSFPINGTPVSIPNPRAWNVVEVQKGSQWFRIFETHLEVLLPTPPPVPPYIYQIAQAGELYVNFVYRKLASPMPTIVLGDCNSPGAASVAALPPTSATYGFMALGQPFPNLSALNPALEPLTGIRSIWKDAWLGLNASSTGFTFGYTETLQTQPLTERLDLVFSDGVSPVSMTTFGATDLTPTTVPLHASDHLGVAATFLAN
jgi:endonuclease/exonuclease/phosphatase family metal-dependent hydrolase